jgi:hypothetical protein
MFESYQGYWSGFYSGRLWSTKFVLENYIMAIYFSYKFLLVGEYDTQDELQEIVPAFWLKCTESSGPVECKSWVGSGCSKNRKI